LPGAQTRVVKISLDLNIAGVVRTGKKLGVLEISGLIAVDGVGQESEFLAFALP
jgi:hypothetical protein